MNLLSFKIKFTLLVLIGKNIFLGVDRGEDLRDIMWKNLKVYSCLFDEKS